MAARKPPQLTNSPRGGSRKKTNALTRLRDRCQDGPLPNGRSLSPAEVIRLRDAARDYQTLLFGIGQLVAITGLDAEVISAVARHAETVFVAGGKARPEWVLAFLQKPPRGFAGK